MSQTQVTWEDYVVDFTGTVAGVEGQRVVCGTWQDVQAWVGANLAAAGVCVVSKDSRARTQLATFGLPGISPPAPPAPPAAPAPPPPQAASHTRVGKPTVPPGFNP